MIVRSSRPGRRSRRLAKAFIPLGLLLLISEPAAGQSEIHGLVGTEHHGGFGWSIAGMNDVTGDGVGEFIIGAPAEDGSVQNTGRAYLVSGATGDIFTTLLGSQQNQEFGYSVAGLGDVTGDGLSEVVIGSPGGDRVHIYSPDGTLIRILAGQPNSRFGTSVASIRDQDGDGLRDVLVGAPFESSGTGITGAVHLFSGQTGFPLGSLIPSFPDGGFGFSVAPAGDHDGDGIADILVGAPGSLLGAGAVFVFKGGAPLQSTLLKWAPGTALGDNLGLSVSRLLDVTGDGVPEVIAGSPGASGGTGQVTVFSGVNMSVLHVFTEILALSLGASVAGTVDLDNDGLVDYIVGAPGTSIGNDLLVGRMYVVSSQTGTIIYSRDGRGAQDMFGFSVAKGLDYNLDGFDDVLVGAPHATTGRGTSLGDEGRGDAYSGFDDCNNNGIPDGLEMGTDCNANGILDVCEEDCNGNGSPDECDLADGTSSDTNGNGIPDSCECAESNTCSTSPNSVGSGSIMSSSGTKSITANDLTLIATGAIPSNFGIFFYGNTSTQVPFGNGFRCVGAPLYRLPVVSTNAAGIGSYLLDNSVPPSSSGQITEFSTWYFQYWYRDPSAGGANFNLSDSLEATFCP
jgi:hypothetical protein